MGQLVPPAHSRLVDGTRRRIPLFRSVEKKKRIVHVAVLGRWHRRCFAEASQPFIGNLDHFGLIGVLDAPSPGSSRIPALLFCIYQCMFAVITAVLAIGGFAERSKIGPVFLFMFCWLTIVYCPIAMWTWNPAGWTFVMGGLDFAGGSPVHISSGTASLAIAVYLGKRRGYGTERLAYKPHNTFFVVLGTIMLWVGWFGFNGGSALAANVSRRVLRWV